jgi:CarD family transcriptional regulator
MPTLSVGDYVVYPAQGVGRVTARERRQVAGDTVAFLSLRILDTDLRILIPEARLDSSGLRPLIGRDSARAVLDVLGQPPDSGSRISWIRRSREYERCLACGEPRAVARVFRDLHLMRLNGALSFGQLQLYERSRRMLIHEVALAVGAEPASIAQQAVERVEAARR